MNPPPKTNKVKNRFLPIPEAVLKGLEPEPKISDFEILKELGAGSFGRVYLVIHKQTKAQYAIKAIDKRNKTNIEEKPYFRREIEIMYKIHHPNVVRLFSHFEDDNYCYFIMEYVQKGNIYSLITKDKTKRLSNHLIAQLMKDVISAVYFLHKMTPPIIHRDIKPENVLLAEGNVAKLTDFGWSNYMQDDEKRTTMCGTPIYLAPEIINESGHDEKVDIWCIGILLFELSSGDIPFIGNDIETLKYNIRQMKIAWPRDMNPEIKNLIMKILKAKPNDRISIPEMLNHCFFTNYIENPSQYLIEPNESLQYKPFVVSTDNPKDPPVIINKKVFHKEKAIRKIRDLSPNPALRPRLEKVSNNNNKLDYNTLKKKYQELNSEYQRLVNSKGICDGSKQKEIEELIKEKEILNKEYDNVMEEMKEKDKKMKMLIRKNISGDNEEVSRLEKENKELKEKIAKYETMLNEHKGMNGLSKTLEELYSLAKGNQDIVKLINEIQCDLDEESKQKLLDILKEKESELQNKISLKDNERDKYMNKINKYNITMEALNKENKDIKEKIKALE